jgi:hypothetical protein
MPAAVKRVKSAKSETFVEHDFQRELLEKSHEDSVLVHNISGGQFHVPLKANNPHDQQSEEVIVFQVDEIRSFGKSELTNSPQFKKCFAAKKLRIITQDEADAIAVERSKKSKRTGKTDKGLHPSGLPNNKRAALLYILDSEDIDELEGYLDKEDRQPIQDAIEDRIADLEGSET